MFDPPYWVGIVEIKENNMIRAARHVFGAEPTEPQLIQFALREYGHLCFSRPVPFVDVKVRAESFKRRMREIRRQTKISQTCTRAQQAIKLDYEISARERKETGREERRADDERKYRLRSIRKAEKHRGH